MHVRRHRDDAEIEDRRGPAHSFAQPSSVKGRVPFNDNEFVMLASMDSGEECVARMEEQG